MKFCRSVPQVNTHRHRLIFDLTSHFQDGGRDVISRMKVLPPGEWTQGAHAAASVSSWSTVH